MLHLSQGKEEKWRTESKIYKFAGKLSLPHCLICNYISIPNSWLKTRKVAQKKMFAISKDTVLFINY
jgi:hypothetical protein